MERQQKMSLDDHQAYGARKVAEIIQARDEAVGRMEKAHMDNASLREQIREAGLENASLAGQLADVQHECVQMKAQRDAAKDAKDDLKGQLITSKQARSDLLEAIRHAELERSSLAEQLCDAQTCMRSPLAPLAEAAHANAQAHGFWDDDPEFGTSIALVHTEVTEAFEEWRAGHGFTEIYSHDAKPEGVPIELADVLIRVFDIAGRYGIDLDEAVLIKMQHNKTRPHKHGGKRA